jgi:hypothetical protein
MSKDYLAAMQARNKARGYLAVGEKLRRLRGEIENAVSVLEVENHDLPNGLRVALAMRLRAALQEETVVREDSDE